MPKVAANTTPKAARRSKAATGTTRRPRKVSAKPRVACTWPGCGDDFSRKQDMQRHVNGSHLKLGLKSCPKPGCTTAPKRKDSMARHVLAKHSDKRQQCPYCVISYPWSGTLRAHIKREHWVEVLGKELADLLAALESTTHQESTSGAIQLDPVATSYLISPPPASPTYGSEYLCGDMRGGYLATTGLPTTPPAGVLDSYVGFSPVPYCPPWTEYIDLAPPHLEGQYATDPGACWQATQQVQVTDFDFPQWQPPPLTFDAPPSAYPPPAPFKGTSPYPPQQLWYPTYQDLDPNTIYGTNPRPIDPGLVYNPDVGFNSKNVKQTPSMAGQAAFVSAIDDTSTIPSFETQPGFLTGNFQYPQNQDQVFPLYYDPLQY